MKRISTAICFTIVMSLSIVQLSLRAQTFPKSFWNDVRQPSNSSQGIRDIIPTHFRLLTLNLDELKRFADQVPMETTQNAKDSPARMSIPLPDGRFVTFAVVEAPIMALPLAAKYPEIRTYSGQGINDPTATIRFDITPAGFHGMVLSAGPTVYIDPYSRGNTREYISYYKHDLPLEESRRFQELGLLGTDSETAREIARIVGQGVPYSIGENLRTYRLALACTGEYAIFHGGAVPGVLAAMVTAMNRVNQIYEREVAVRMVLIANNDTLIYTNPSTDPYTNSDGGAMLSQNQSTINSIIGSTNYDIGHMFSTGGGGIAGLGVVCVGSQKAWGVTGLPSPIGDPFYVDYVAHEMGHQFGGNHSFNGTASACGGGNRNGSTAYEPGSGSTIMSYAGICGTHDIQSNSDDYFHVISINEIVAYTTAGNGSFCPEVTPTGNTPPVSVAGPGGITIPLGTAFSLTGSGSDANGDSLTYCWEQFDLGPGGHPNSPSGNAPIFRSFKGTLNPTRIFPRMQDIINNTQTIGEILPSYTRTLHFRLIVRDNRAGGGGVGTSALTLPVAAAGPFRITSPDSVGSWKTNSIDTVRWNVASTNLAPVNCATVNIFLSTNGGQTFEDTLAMGTPNDGIEPVVVPDIVVESARVKIEAADNIFFDFSNLSFSIARILTPALVAPPNNAQNQPHSLMLVWRQVEGANAYHVQASRNAEFTLLVLNDSTATDTARALTGLLGTTNYYWRVKAKSDSGSSGWSGARIFRTAIAPPGQPTLSQPPNNSTDQPTSPILRWNLVLFSSSYQLKVATDSLFTAIVVDDSVVGVQRMVNLQPQTKYYWRVQARNAGGLGVPSPVWNFTTQFPPLQTSLVFPAPGAVVSDDSVQFLWNRVPTTSVRYWLELAADSLFTGSTVDSTITDTTNAVSNLIDNATYFWRVRAGNTAGWGPYSETRSFTVVTTDVQYVEGTPVTFALMQNYPNPFNPSTTISYTLPVNAHTMLHVFDLLGREVAVLVNEKQSPGTHEVDFDGSNLGSGVYLYRLQSGQFVETRKLLLMK